MKKGIVWLVLVMVFICFSSEAFAKTRMKSSSGWGGRSKSSSSYGSSRSSSRDSSSSTDKSSRPSSKSDSGWSGKSTKKDETQSTKKSSSGWSGKSQAASGSQTSKPVGRPAVTKNAAAQAKTKSISKVQSQKAMSQYKAEQSKFKLSGSPVAASPAVQKTVLSRVVVNNYHYSPGIYAYRHNYFYSRFAWSPPIYGYGFHPYYGLWDTVALWFMIDHIADQQYANMYYSHRNDEDMRAWRQQAEREAENNAELRQKLASMDSRMLAMEKEGAKVDPGYVPIDMKDVALSEEALKGTAIKQ